MTLTGGSSDGKTFCISATNAQYPDLKFYVTNSATKPASGVCNIVIADGSPIQTITTANCPSAAYIRAVDTRDNHTYWVQKLADGKCWMLTNLAYAGGGTNTYGDVKTITNSTSSSTLNSTVASYYVVPSTTNYTSEPTPPSSSKTGVGQYGYLYNFCAANGGQTGNGACSSSSSTAVNTSISICPAGWRLPTGDATTGEFVLLNNAINGGSISSSTGLLQTWLGQYGSSWAGSFAAQGVAGDYWSSLQTDTALAREFSFDGTSVRPSWFTSKSYAVAVRCVAN